MMMMMMMMMVIMMLIIIILVIITFNSHVPVNVGPSQKESRLFDYVVLYFKLQLVFLRKYIGALWASIAQMIFSCNFVSNVFGKYWQDNIPMQCFPSKVEISLYRLFFS